MPLTITQSNKKDYISRDFIFNTRKDKIVIGWKVFGIGKNFEIACEDVIEFKVLDENSKSFKTSSALKKTGGAVVGGLLTGGVGAIIGAMISGNKTTKDLKINLGFKLKNKDWFIATLDIEDKESFTGGMEKSVIEEVIKRFSTKSEAPF
ncbi:hypothetical protein OAS12_01520 [Candidatus Pelagibacter ubique]|nr:hypothetical protein [Candidatus Pelagibacter ubique]